MTQVLSAQAALQPDFSEHFRLKMSSLSEADVTRANGFRQLIQLHQDLNIMHTTESASCQTAFAFDKPLTMLRTATLSILLGCSWVVSFVAGDDLLFNRDIKPILSDKCFACHGPAARAEGTGLRLDLRDSAVTDWEVIVPGKPDDSELVRRIESADDGELMPPPETHKPLSAGERALLRQWIAEGAEYESHWSYRPLKRPDVPTAKVKANPIDAFIDARLKEQGIEPMPEADPITLIRRLSFDLTGMPPTIAEVDAFVNDRSDDAYEKLVDRLLASPRYGERMATYWLDLVRYADTVGYHGDQNVSQSPYRDYVIRAFNENLPYDQFIREQLAGDLLPNATLEQRIASGYNRLNQTTEEGGSQAKEYLAIYFADRVRNLSQVYMGATMGCAQCHDHKYDPFTMRDFYSIGAFFADINEKGVYGARKRPPELRLPSKTQQEQLAELASSITELQQADKEDPRIKELQDKKKKIEEAVVTTVVSESVEPRVIRILPRGNWMDDSGEVVQPAIPSFLGKLELDGRRATRLDLANWLGEPDNVLTSRTMANRMWYLLFGRGLSTSVDDLGGQGVFPTHPELLDWLAMEFVESGWDVKHLLRIIVSTEAYRRTSASSMQLMDSDPDNNSLARQGRFPLSAEMVRDNTLFVSGLLVETIGGASARPYQPAGYYAELNFPKRTYVADRDESQYRRGVYTHWQRTFLHPMLKAFDAPSREECTAARARSNTPLMALTLLNDPTFVEAARVLAARMVREGGDTVEERLTWAYRATVSREPEEEIAELLHGLFDSHLAYYRENSEEARKLVSVGYAPQATDLDPVELAAWTNVARTLLNLNEAIVRY